MRGILTYHSIDSSGSPISVAAESFAEHARFLASGSVRVVALEAMAQPRVPGAPPEIAITFDDGFTNFATEAWPILREHGLPATLFVVTDRTGTRNSWDTAPGHAIPSLPLLGWDELGRLAEQGLTLGAHGRTHASLPGLSPSELEEEVLGSRERLRRATGRAPAAFAYPFGDVDAPSAAAARGAFACAVTTRFALLGDQPDPHLLPRIDAYYLRSGDRLRSFGRPGFRRWLAARGVVRRAGVIARRLVPTPKLGKHAGAPTMESQVEDEEPERGA